VTAQDVRSIPSLMLDVLTSSQALEEYLPSSGSWKYASDVLPTKNLSSTQEEQREEYTARWKEANLNLYIGSSTLFRRTLVRCHGDNQTGHVWGVGYQDGRRAARGTQLRRVVWVFRLRFSAVFEHVGIFIGIGCGGCGKGLLRPIRII